MKERKRDRGREQKQNQKKQFQLKSARITTKNQHISFGPVLVSCLCCMPMCFVVFVADIVCVRALTKVSRVNLHVPRKYMYDDGDGGGVGPSECDRVRRYIQEVQENIVHYRRPEVQREIIDLICEHDGQTKIQSILAENGCE